MRSVLVTLGPWDWPAVFAIMAVLTIMVILWRRLEQVIEEETAPLTTGSIVAAGTGIVILSIALLVAVNRFGPIKVRSWGFMLLLGFAVATWYVTRIGRPRGITFPMLLDLVMIQLVSAILCSRIMYVLLKPSEFAGFSEMAALWSGGLSFHGGLLGAVLATFAFAYWRKIRLAVLADLCTLGIPIGYALTRIGCFLNGCCYGRPTDLPWGMVMPETPRDVPLHPTQLYASAGSLIVFAILRWLWPRMHRPGQLFPMYMILYSTLRFLCEFTRYGVTGEPSGLFPSYTVAQVASVGVAAAGLLIFIAMQSMPAEDPMQAKATTEDTVDVHGSR